MSVEFYEAETEEELNEAMQRRINDGSIWRMEGSAGRTAMSLINGGLCMLGREGNIDYFGNYVPSRTDVKSGTKGSFTYVSDLQGSKYAKHIASI